MENFIKWQNVHRLPKGNEMTPFVFKGKDYLLVNTKNHAAYKCYPQAFPSVGIHDDHFIIKSVTEDRIISAPLYNCYFASASVIGDKVYCFCVDYEMDRPWWTCRRILMIESEDLITWSKPQIAVEAEEGESLFNNDITFDGKFFYILYETDDPKWNPKFTFKFAKSTDLVHWEKIPDAVYGKGKYVGGPGFEFFDGWFYVTYVNIFQNPEDGRTNYDTRIARSRNLIDWEEAPEGRSVLLPNYQHSDPTRPELIETNASDAEFLEKDGKVYVYWNGGNQENMGGAYAAEYPGTLQALFESFFK